MKRLAIISTMLFVFLTGAKAQPSEDYPRITYGAEWSYVASGFSAYHYNYFSPEGYRYNSKGASPRFVGNGEGLLHVGYNVTDSWNLAVYAGFTGIADIHNAIPVSFRATRFFRQDMKGDRWFTFADAGTGISIKKHPQEVVALKIGGGYRVSLSRDTKLDFIASFRLACTHPQILDGEDIITLEWTNRNLALLRSITLGMSITF
jgi:hypothetical protein